MSESGPVAVAPTITSSATFNAAENQTAVGTVTATGTAPITFSITGGADAAAFDIDSGTGVLTFDAAPDFETPGDVGGNNVYDVTVTATGPGGVANQNVAVTVTDVAEAPAGFLAQWKFNTGITEAGTGVSQWNDTTGTYHLTQATDSKRPSKEADGSILFNGTSDGLSNVAINQASPFTIYALMKQVTWTSGRYIWNNNNVQHTKLQQAGVTPTLYLSGTNGNVAANTNLTLNTYKALGVVYNGASSLIHVNGSAATTGDPGDGGGTLATFVLGQLGFDLFHTNIQVKEILIYAAAHDGTQRQTVFDYLAGL